MIIVTAAELPLPPVQSRTSCAGVGVGVGAGMHLHSLEGQLGGCWLQFLLHHASVAFGLMLWHCWVGVEEAVYARAGAAASAMSPVHIS